VTRSIPHVTCGLARRCLANILREQKQTEKVEWHNSFVRFNHNPSTLGFLVEEACLDMIYVSGLRVGHKTYMPKNIHFFDDIPDLTKDLKPRCELYIPKAWNYKAIDGLIFSVHEDDKKQSAIHLIPIQITISSKEKHTDSVQGFLSRWCEYESKLAQPPSCTFVWILRDCDVTKKVQQYQPAERELRNSKHTTTYEHTEEQIALSSVSSHISQALEAAITARRRTNTSALSELTDTSDGALHRLLGTIPADVSKSKRTREVTAPKSDKDSEDGGVPAGNSKKRLKTGDVAADKNRRGKSTGHISPATVLPSDDIQEKYCKCQTKKCRTSKRCCCLKAGSSCNSKCHPGITCDNNA
jgi:hypothetical protein